MYMFEMLHVTYIMLRQIHKIINGKVIYCLVRFYANLLYCFHSWKTLMDITYFLFHGKIIQFLSWKSDFILFQGNLTSF